MTTPAVLQGPTTAELLISCHVTAPEPGAWLNGSISMAAADVDAFTPRHLEANEVTSLVVGQFRVSTGDGRQIRLVGIVDPPTTMMATQGSLLTYSSAKVASLKAANPGRDVYLVSAGYVGDGAVDQSTTTSSLNCWAELLAAGHLRVGM